MTEIKVAASKTYSVLVGKGFSAQSGSLIRKAVGGEKICLVSDGTVFDLHGKAVTESLNSAGYEVFPFVFPPGEESKSTENFVSLLEFLAEKGITRSDVIAGLGGGVTGDLAGFAASAFLRGVKLVHIPTTLLAMADSSVGGKTAVNLNAGKNLAGAFYQPDLVLCDTAFLDTLPEDIFRDGLAEVIKYGVLKEPKILKWIENPCENIEKIVESSVKIKREIVQTDEKDNGIRQTLNLGHTVGHAVEAASGYSVSHGKAVAIGMAVIAKAAYFHGECSLEAYENITAALKSVSLPYTTDFSADTLAKYMLSDKKRKGTVINLIIPEKIGRCCIKPMSAEDLSEYISWGLKETKTVFPAVLSGEIAAPPSKSYAHRLLICAALSEKPVKIQCRGISEDISATINVLRGLGAEISVNDEGFSVSPINLKNPKNPQRPLNCGESGSTLRFLLPVICALGVNAELEMKGRLPNRPLSPLYEELVRHGARLSEAGKSPLRVSGKLENPHFKISGNVSSQFVSGLLFALPLMGGGKVEIEGDLQSADYVEMTLDALKTAGISILRKGNTIEAQGTYKMPETAAVEGDFSNGAFWICAGAIGKKPLEIRGLTADSLQGDRKILEIARNFGADIKIEAEKISVRPQPLKGITLDASQIPDLVPAVSILAAVAEGETRIQNAGRLRLKESDRLSAIYEVMSALGADVSQEEDSLIFRGKPRLSGGAVSSHNDHRIAMMAAISALACENPVTVFDWTSVNKSYPDFFDELAKFSGKDGENK